MYVTHLFSYVIYSMLLYTIQTSKHRLNFTIYKLYPGELISWISFSFLFDVTVTDMWIDIGRIP